MATIYSRLAVLAHRGIIFHIDPLWSMATIYSRLAVLAHRARTFHIDPLWPMATIYPTLAVLGYRGITFHYKFSLVDRHNLLQTCRFGLWCLTPLSTLFQVYRGGRKKLSTCRKSLSRLVVLVHRGIAFHYQSALVNDNNLL